MRALLLLIMLLIVPVAAAEPLGAYQPLAFLAGHCWRGSFADGAQSDEHCFSWIYGGKFLRDVHVVRGPGHADHTGESIYFWDSVAGELGYLYIESDGGFSRGTVTAEGTTLVFPPTRYIENGAVQTYRSRWQRDGAEAYDVVSEFEGKNGWVPGFKVHLRRVSAGP